MVTGGVVVPGELCLPLARVALVGAKTLMDRNASRRLDTGLTAVIGDLARFKDEPAFRIVASTAMGSWLSAADAAVVADVSRQHVTRLCRRGRLIARRAGYTWLVDRQSAEDYRRARAA